ncbi:hypothetical protein Lal_00008022 [Lupinus albus]|nr:hypothetical protein Lal_00008022 [Lupinus albus]
MGIDTVYNTRDAMIHNAQIPSNHLRVSIDISIKDDVLFPIPIDEDTITIGRALGTYVAWPEHLIDVVPIMGKVSADHSATSPPRKLPGDFTIIISIPLPIYGFLVDEFINRSDVKDVHDHDWIGASVISMYIRPLAKTMTKIAAITVVLHFRCGIDNFHSTMFYIRCGREHPINKKIEAHDIFNSEVFYIRCGIYICHIAMFYMRCGIDIINNANSRIRC